MNVIIAGDYCPRNRTAALINAEEYQSVLGEVKDIKKEADYFIVNLECPVVVREASPIEKCGPNLRCNKKGFEALKWTGCDCVTLANNHFYDYGEIGVKDTLDVCKEFNIDHVGGGKNASEAAITLYKVIDGQCLAIINCCEHEFSIATDKSGGSNQLNVVNQFYAIQEARKNSDFVLVIIHGGVELFWLPSKRMIETYRFFIDAGADAVVNHHQHCYSGYELYKNKPIFYGVGNFCFDKNSNDYGDYRWTSGYMVNIKFEKSNVANFDIIPYRQCAENATVKILKGAEKDDFYKKIKNYNEIISDDKRIENEYMNWCCHTEKMYMTVLNPVFNRYTAFLFKSRLGNRIISKRKLLQIYDYLVNESHIERVRLLFKKEINNR
jgi:poly-gamma-glutamate synthesis protein (capsule biosynthesis protein)